MWPPKRLLTTTAGTDDALLGAQLPGDARMSSRRAIAPNQVQTRERRNGFWVTAPFPAPMLGSPDIKKRLFVPFPQEEKEPAGGMTRYFLLPKLLQKEADCQKVNCPAKRGTDCHASLRTGSQ